MSVVLSTDYVIRIKWNPFPPTDIRADGIVRVTTQLANILPHCKCVLFRGKLDEVSLFVGL